MTIINHGDPIPNGDWRLFTLITPIMMMKMDGAFSVRISDYQTEGQAGDFLATCGHGKYWIVTADEAKNSYKEMTNNGVH